MTEVVALTGATGFIGQYVTAALLERGWRVRALVRPPAKAADFPAQAELNICQGSLADSASLRELVRGADAVVHLAGAIRGRSYRDFAAVNVNGSANLIEACLQEAPLSRFIHISSLAAREPGLSWYARSKHAGESLVADSGLAYSVLRPPAVYGPEDPAMAPVWRNLARGRLLRAGPPDARFSLLHAQDLAEAICRLLEAPQPAMRVLEIGDGHARGYSYPEIAEIAASRLNRRVRTVPVPSPLLRAAAGLNLAAARLTGRKPILVPGKVRELIHPDWVCDNTALKQHLGWCPCVQLEDCIGALPGWDGIER